MIGDASRPLSPVAPQSDLSGRSAATPKSASAYPWQMDWRIGAAAVLFNLVLLLLFGRLI